MHLILHPKTLILLLAVLVTIVCISIRRFLARRQFARQHGCQPVARSLNKDPFLGLDTIPETLRAASQHRILERKPENIKTILSLNFKDYGLSHRLQPFKPLLGEGIFDTDGAH
ncbi:hypothetical protein AFUB_095200 [Aspergillus fumigatus A1163]|uniref:Uncharacterized protein n=1 Tax=Aspergillus fumigatus (strain CBS 144.89 / FGSC A1163 / CEA10) TaxID=451804 RepID=B0YDD7_ASPFC|nr:hypothetical protein AFUB_095200 [Aspergillus fumigatus A1163]